MMSNKYELAIQNKDVSSVFDMFATDLEKFIIECRRIRTEFRHCDHSDSEIERHLKMEYSRAWSRFTHKIPFPYYDEYIGDDEKIRMTEILPKGRKVNGYEDYISDLLNNIVRYNAYILLRNNINNRDIILYASLKTIAKSVDLSSMIITPNKVIKIVDSVMVDIKNGTFKRPVATLWNGTLYENEKLNSSRKVAIYRGSKLIGFLDTYIDEYRKMNNGELPSRDEVRKYLIKRCASSGDPKLSIFKDKMNEKTLAKLIEKGGYQNLVSSKRKKNNEMKPPIEISTIEPNKKMTLLEVYQFLKEGLGSLQKNN